MGAADIKAAREAANAAQKAAKTAFDHFTHCVDQVAKDLADPNKTGSDADPWSELKHATSDIEQTSYEAFKAQLKLRMTQAGADAGDVENWLESHAKEVWSKAQELRKSKAAKALATADKWFLAKVYIGLVFGGLTLTAITGYHAPETQAEKDYHEIHARAKNLNEQIGYLDHVIIPEDQFNVMVGGLLVSPAPTPTPDTPAPEAAEAPKPIEAAPAPIEIPAVAAVETAPIVVDVETSGARQSVVSTVGQVYRNSPSPVQHAIEQHAIQHDYNNDNSAAFAQHLHQMSEDWSRRNFPSSQNQTNNIHIDAVDGNGVRFGSANFHQ